MQRNTNPEILCVKRSGAYRVKYLCSSQFPGKRSLAWDHKLVKADDEERLSKSTDMVTKNMHFSNAVQAYVAVPHFVHAVHLALRTQAACLSAHSREVTEHELTCFRAFFSSCARSSACSASKMRL